MLPYLFLGVRAFLLVGLVAMNTRYIANGDYKRAGMCSSALACVWWMNVEDVGQVDRMWGMGVYALGSALGTVTGMRLVKG